MKAEYVPSSTPLTFPKAVSTTSWSGLAETIAIAVAMAVQQLAGICHLKTEITHADLGRRREATRTGERGQWRGERSWSGRVMAPSRRRRVDGVARGAESTSSAKRAKVDEAKEEEDPLVRRKEELVVAAKEARSREDARAERVAKKELVALCADFEAKNEKLLGRLPPELWQKILDENLDQNDLLALAMTCRFFREKQKDLGKKVETDLHPDRLLRLQKSGKMPSHTLGWFRWVCDTFEIMPGHET